MKFGYFYLYIGKNLNELPCFGFNQIVIKYIQGLLLWYFRKYKNLVICLFTTNQGKGTHNVINLQCAFLKFIYTQYILNNFSSYHLHNSFHLHHNCMKNDIYCANNVLIFANFVFPTIYIYLLQNIQKIWLNKRINRQFIRLFGTYIYIQSGCCNLDLLNILFLLIVLTVLMLFVNLRSSLGRFGGG